VCCTEVPLDGGTSPACNVVTVTSSCEAPTACPSRLSPTATECSGVNQFRVCSKPSDCTEANFTACCTFTEGAMTMSFCFPPEIASIANGRDCVSLDAGTDAAADAGHSAGHDAGHD
jgi:hypothetical protein